MQLQRLEWGMKSLLAGRFNRESSFEKPGCGLVVIFFFFLGGEEVVGMQSR